MALEATLVVMNQMLHQMQQDRSHMAERMVAMEARTVAAENNVAQVMMKISQVKTANVDAKRMEKIKDFNGKKKEWSDWNAAFRAQLTEQTKQALDWASAQTSRLTEEYMEIEKETILPGGDVGKLDNELYATLALKICLLYTSPSPRDLSTSRMPSSA